MTLYEMSGQIEKPQEASVSTTKTQPAPLTRTVAEVAREIEADYRQQGKPVFYAAVPYVTAMHSLSSLSDRYFEDSGVDVVRYAVSNLGTWRGETAKRIKAELRSALAHHDERPKRGL